MLRIIWNMLRVNRNDNTLRPESFRRLFHEFRPLNSCRIDADLVGAGLEQVTDVLDRPHAAAHGQGHEDLLCRPAHDVKKDLPFFMGRRDVEKAEFVRSACIVCAGRFHRIARVLELNEADALDDASCLHIQAGYDALR